LIAVLTHSGAVGHVESLHLSQSALEAERERAFDSYGHAHFIHRLKLPATRSLFRHLFQKRMPLD
jgi:hypothetical protein